MKIFSSMLVALLLLFFNTELLNSVKINKSFSKFLSKTLNGDLDVADSKISEPTTSERHHSKRARGCRAPTNKTEVPANNTEVPANNTYIPENNTYIPENNTYIPENNTYIPENNTYIPENNTYIPENNTYIPENNTYIPENNTYIPENNTYIPENNTYIPHNPKDSEGILDSIRFDNNNPSNNMTGEENYNPNAWRDANPNLDDGLGLTDSGSYDLE
jgi:hypothetical protein